MDYGTVLSSPPPLSPYPLLGPPRIMGLWMWHKEKGAFFHVRLGTQHSTPGLSAGRSKPWGWLAHAAAAGDYGAGELEEDRQGRLFSQVSSVDGDSNMSPGGSLEDAVTPPTSLHIPPSLMKSVSTPSIATSDSNKGHDLRQGSTSDADASEGPDTPRDGSPPCSIRRLLAEHDAQVAKQSAGEEDEDEALNAYLQSQICKPRLSMIEFLQPAPKGLQEDERKKRGEPKEEKKRRSSVFSKLGSYRQKKVPKDNKLIRNTHEFVSVSFSNSTSCDVCSRSMANKPALQCENCMVNVHENSCKDQIAPCARLKSSSPRMPKFQSASLPGHGAAVTASGASAAATVAGTNLKGSQSFKECKRAASVPSARPALQVSQSGSNLLPRSSSPSSGLVTSPAAGSTSPASSARGGGGGGGTGSFQWRRVATKLGIDKVINEEREKEGISGGMDENDGTPPPKTPPVNNHVLSDSNIVDTLSVSIESLDEVSNEVTELSDDPELFVPPEGEPEAWSVTVDKKTLKKMSAKDIKKQDHIWEFIQTEKSHCRTLKIIQKVFAAGMVKECNLSTGTVDRVFPKLSDLIDIHLHFLHMLTERQRMRPDKSIENIGDVLLAQFQGEMGTKMKHAYGEFCSRHNESVQLYKDILKSDRKFQTFIKKCSRNNVCKRLGIPECILLVTQRMTKYPLLIESIIKATKENKYERDMLTTVLGLTRDILSYVDLQVDAHEKEQKLFEIYNKLDARQSTLFKGKKFKKSDLLMNSRKLLHEGSIKWMSARGKPCEVIAVILSDLMFFLMENNQKYSFFTQDNKSSVISLSKLLVREKGDTRDSKGIYLICQSKTEPEMYELVCRSADDRKAWVKIIRDAIQRCPEEDEGVPSESEEERKLLEARAAKMRQIIDSLHEKDSGIRNLCEDKMRLVVDMQELFCKDGETPPPFKSVYKDEEEQELLDPDILVQEVSNEATRLLSLVQQLHPPLLPATNLYRSVTSVGEHESGTYQTPPLPKRAETFSGFDGKEREKTSVKRRYPSAIQDSDSRSNSLHDLVEADSGVSLENVNDKKTNLQRRQSFAVVKLDEANKVNKERMSRRMSTSFLQNLLIKQHGEKDNDADSTKSDRSMSSGSVGDLSPTVPPSMREQCNCAAQLLSYVHSLVAITAQQSTEVESFRAMLQEANSKVSMLYSENHTHTKSYHHDKQLEELRNLQEQLRSEKTDLAAWKASEHGALERHQDELRADSACLEAERADLKAQRDELHKKKEMLQRQMDLFEQQRATWNRQYQQDGAGSSDRDRSQSPSTVASASLFDMISHKRSASDDLQHSRASPLELQKAEHSNSLKEAGRGFYGDSSKKEVKCRSQSVSSTVRKDSMTTGAMPLHLLSTTNEQKLASHYGAGASNAVAPGGAPASGSTHPSPPNLSQMLPHKLSASTSPGLTRPPKSRPGPLSPPPRLMHAKSQPVLNVGSIRLLNAQRGPVPAASTGNMLPMKLAEALGSKQRPKSAGPPSSSPNTTGSKKTTQEIIYF